MQTPRPILWLLLIASTCGIYCRQDVAAADPLQEGTIIGRRLGEFALTDYRGREITPADFSPANVLVIAFLGVECPLAKLYSERLQAIFSDFKDRGVMVLGVDANQQDSLAEMAVHARNHHIAFPFAKDTQQALVSSLGATRTPEVFVLDSQRTVKYFGRIDDQYGVGFIREAPTKNDLRDAIDSVLNNQPLAIAHQPAPGCLIGRIKQPRADAQVTYSNQVARIFADHCVRCHREHEIGPFAMTDYQEIVGWAEMILEVVQEKRMPPWHANPAYGKFANDCSLSDAERELIQQWVADGAPLRQSKRIARAKRICHRLAITSPAGCCF